MTCEMDIQEQIITFTCIIYIKPKYNQYFYFYVNVDVREIQRGRRMENPDILANTDTRHRTKITRTNKKNTTHKVTKDEQCITNTKKSLKKQTNKQQQKTKKKKRKLNPYAIAFMFKTSKNPVVFEDRKTVRGWETRYCHLRNGYCKSRR